MIVPIEFRTCLFHPSILATRWRGHVHMYTPLGDTHIIVGLCKTCHKWEEYHYKVNGQAISNQERGCIGCYGKYKGSMR